MTRAVRCVVAAHNPCSGTSTRTNGRPRHTLRAWRATRRSTQVPCLAVLFLQPLTLRRRSVGEAHRPEGRGWGLLRSFARQSEMRPGRFRFWSSSEGLPHNHVVVPHELCPAHPQARAAQQHHLLRLHPGWRRGLGAVLREPHQHHLEPRQPGPPTRRWLRLLTRTQGKSFADAQARIKKSD